LVCRLCGTANAAQQASCTVCGWPLERQPEAQGPRKHADSRTASGAWLLLCLLLGAGLGLVGTRRRLGAPPTLEEAIIGLALGAVAGAILGLLPGPGWRTIKRQWAAFLVWLFTSIFKRKLAQVARSCDRALKDDPTDLDTQVRLAGMLWLEETRERSEQVLLRLADAPDSPALVKHNFAVLQAAAGRHTLAIDALQQARPRMSGSVNLAWNLGLSRWSQNQLVEASESFHDVLRIDPDHLGAHNALALVLARQGELDQAIGQLEESLKARGRDPDVLCNLGIIHQARGDLAIATRYFTGALQRQPGHIAARYNRGVCAMLQGHYHAAIEDFSGVNRAAPDHGWALIQKGCCWYRLGQTGRALEAIRHAMRSAPGDFVVRYNAGTLMLREGMVEQAVRELERAYELDPRSIDIIVNLGVATYLDNRVRQALDHFRAAGRINPKHVLARYNCAIAAQMMELYDEAERELEDLMQLYTDFPEVFNAIGVVRMLQGRVVDAAEQFRRAADAMPRSAIVRSNLSLCYYFEGDLAAAAEQARLAANLDPQLAPAHDLLGHVCVDLNQPKEAIEYFRTLVKLEPSNPDAHANLGLAFYKDDRLNDAVESYKRVLIFSPRSAEGHNDLGLAYAKNKMLTEAIRHINQVIEWRPSNPIARSNLGLLYFFNGDTEDAVMQWREVTRLSPAYARMREATRFSAYDDQEMVMRPIDRRKRSVQFPLKVAGFRHSFQLALDQSGYRMELPWPDLAAAARWRQRVQRARAAMLTP
jgi:Flp pilus assembly protein TadD